MKIVNADFLEEISDGVVAKRPWLYRKYESLGTFTQHESSNKGPDGMKCIWWLQDWRLEIRKDGHQYWNFDYWKVFDKLIFLWHL